MRTFLIALICGALLACLVMPARAAECGDVKPDAADDAYIAVLSDTVRRLAEDEILIAFEHGDIRRPVVIGSLWNGAEKPPESLPAWWLPEVDDEVLVLFALDDEPDDDDKALRRQYQTISNASKARHEIELRIEGVRDLAGGSEESLDLAKALDRQLQCLQALSKILKAASDAGKTATQNIRG